MAGLFSALHLEFRLENYIASAYLFDQLWTLNDESLIPYKFLDNAMVIDVNDKEMMENS